MGDSKNTTKKSSIMCYLTEGSTEELTYFKELLDSLKALSSQSDANEKSNTPKRKSINKLSEASVNVKLETVIDSCVQRSKDPASSTNKKSDMALKIVETLNANYDLIENNQKISDNLCKFLTSEFFEKLTKLFQTNAPGHALKMVKAIIGILGKLLHNNLPIINPLLQIMELAFKHNVNEIKANSYECWGCLIDNFATDRDFFFKPKKFNLILMPLMNKCKTFKEEDVCKAKILAWVRLIENVNNKLPEHFAKVVVPFLNYCFGLTNLNEPDEDDEDTSQSSKQKMQNKYNKTLTPEHNFQSLTQVGFEMLVSILFNGDLSWLNDNLKKKFKHVNLHRNYNIKAALAKDASLWAHLHNCFFQLILNKTNTVYDSTVVLKLWKRMCNLLKIKHDEKDEDYELVMEDDDEECDNLNYLVEQFLFNSVEFVNSSGFNSKALDNKFMVEFGKHLVIALTNEYKKYLYKNESFKGEVLKMIKKLINTMFESNEENVSIFLDNIQTIQDLIESSSNLIDIYNWFHLINKLHDYFKSIKAKTNVLNLTTKNNNTVHSLITFVFKHFKKLDVKETDIKLMVSSCTNLIKFYTSLIKQNRVKLDNGETMDVNAWCSRVFLNLKLKYDPAQCDSIFNALLNYWASYSTNSHSLSSSAPTNIDYTIKVLQLNTQITLFILQNVFEFDVINQHQTSSQSDSGADDAPALSQKPTLSIIEKMNKKVENSPVVLFANLTELVQKQVKLFYDFLINQTGQNTQAKNQLQMDDSSNDTNDEAGNGKVQENNKQPLQIFSCLIEILSYLFTRVKVHQVLNEFLINFATSIELISELHSISKTSAATLAPFNEHQSPSSNQHKKHNHTRLSMPANNQHPLTVILQSNKRSNDLYETFSMQIASYIQNHLTKTYFPHEFDSALLKKLEPIFYAFLKYSTKLSLKQKTLQAWNSTFGKSTISSLSYSKRLEKLFIELREEMINSSRSGGSNSTSQRSNMGLIAISLPGFKPIDLLNQATNTTNSYANEMDDCMQNEEKENTPENVATSGGDQNGDKNEARVSIGTNKSSIKEYLNESSMSSSVPMVQPVKSHTNNVLSSSEKNKKPTEPFKKQLNENTTTITANFVFSPAGNSFLNTINTNLSSASASKVTQLKTTPNSSNTNKSSPRSLKQHSKRKLDLNVLIDQMPDKDFVKISKQNSNCNLLNKFNTPTEKLKDEASSNKKPSPAKGNKLFKQPLTEHQKEVRKQKSFIPMEMQSVCAGLEHTMDSQMSCTQDDFEDSMQSQSVVLSKNATPKQMLQFAISKSEKANLGTDENANDQMDMDKEDDMLLANMELSTSISNKGNKVEEKNSPPKEDPPLPAVISTIKFHSKLNPKKEIELVELKADTTEQTQASAQTTTETTTSKPAEKETAEQTNQNEPESEAENSNKLESNEQEANGETKRRSLRIKSKLNTTNTEADDAKPAEALSQAAASQDADLSQISKLERFKLKNNLSKNETNKQIYNFYLNSKVKQQMMKQQQRTDSKLNTNLRVNFKKSQKISFKEKMEYNLKLMKYKKLIKNIKTENKEDLKIKNVERLNRIKEIQMEFLSNSSNESDLELVEIKETNIPKVASFKPAPKEEEESVNLDKSMADISMTSMTSDLNESKTAEPEKNESINQKSNANTSTDDDEDEPLAKLIEKKVAKKVQEQTSEPPAPVVPVTEKPKPEEKIESKLESVTEEEPPVVVVNKNLIINSSMDIESAPSTPILANNPDTARLTRSCTYNQAKLTPTTSILKKRESKFITNSVGKALIDSKAGVDNNTPNKRRVSFCESVQIEEIEPNFNKSLFNRSTPKLQNKAKLVLSPYFNKPGTTLTVTNSNITSNLSSSSSSNSPLAATTANTAANSTLNSSSLTAVSFLNNEQKDSVSKVANTNSLVPSSPNVQPTASSKIPANLNIPASISNLAQAKLNQNRLSESVCLSPSYNGASSNTNGPMSVPSSPSSSLISFFSNNKPSFLSQRQQQIQQQMLQQQQNKTDTSMTSNTSAPSTPLIQSNAQHKSAVNTPTQVQNQSPVKAGLKQSQTTPKSEELRESLAREIREAADSSLYSKFKNSRTSIEALLLDDNEYLVYFNKGASKILNSKNINTIGDLCSLSSAELNNLPFRLPKQTNFMAFIQRYENSLGSDQSSSEQELNVLAKISSATPAPFIGSVEEEMAKLEASNCLDTSIECEAFQIEAQQNMNAQLASSATVEKPVVEETKEDKPKEVVIEEKEAEKSIAEHSNMDVDAENNTKLNEAKPETVKDEASAQSETRTQFEIISSEFKSELDKNLSEFLKMAKTKVKPESTSVKDLYDLYGLDNNIDELQSNFNDAFKSFRSKIKEIAFNSLSNQK